VAALRQTHFGAGELSPLLWGRSDLALYRAGLRRLRDFIITRQGLLQTRPGTEYRGGAYANAPSRLVPFLVTDSDGYLLEFSSTGSLQVWRNGAKVGGPLPYPWAFTPVYELAFAQTGDVLTICAKFAVYELRRTGPTTFAFSTWTVTRPAPEWVQLPGGARTTVPYLAKTTLLAASSTTPARPWRWWVTALVRDAQGRVWETEGTEVTSTIDASNALAPYDGTAVVGPDRPVTVTRKLFGATWAGTRVHEVLAYNYYRGMGDYSGFVGSTTKELDFVDVGVEPDYTLPHPRAVNPFQWTVPSGVILDWPRTVAFYQDRLCFGGTFYRPEWLLQSESGNYTGWQRPPIPLDDAALEWALAVRKRETVRGLVASQHLLLFTDASVWAQGPEVVGPKTPPRLVAEVGSAPLAPLLVGQDVLFVRARGRGVQVVRPSENAPGLVSVADVSWTAEHLFREDGAVAGVIDWWRATGKTLRTEVVDWAWAEEPQGLVWLVRADGQLLSLQWQGGLSGFARHSTGSAWGDRFESVAAVPEGDEDAVYVCVRRGAAYNIERFTSRTRRGTVADDCCLDCAVAFTEAPGSPLVSVAAGLEGREVWLVAKDNAPVGPIVVFAGKADLAKAGFVLPVPNNGGNVTGWVGLLYQPELETLDAVPQDGRLRAKTVTKVGVEVSDSKGLSVGQSPNALTQWVSQTLAAGYGVPPLSSEVVEVAVRGGWDTAARVTLRQTLPLPLTVLGVTREVDGGG
jgi:hypothetical protein